MGGVSLFRSYNYLLVFVEPDNAGLADKEEKKQKEESQEEHCPMDEVVDYEQPAEEIDSQVCLYGRLSG